MINKLLSLLAIISLLFAFKPIGASADYSIVIETMGYRVTSNLLSIFFLCLITILLIRIITRLKHSILSAIQPDSRFLLEKAFLSFCNEDIKFITKLAKKVAPISSLIAKVMSIKKALIESSDKHFLLKELDALPTDLIRFALVNKMKIYLSCSDWVNLKKTADELWDIQPTSLVFSNMLLSAFQRKSWLEAKDILKKGYKKDFITNDTHNKLLCLLNYLSGLDLLTFSPDDAIKKFKNAIDLAIAEPYVEIVKLNIEKGDFKNAIYYAKKAWSNFPDKRLTDQIMKLSKSLTKKDFYSACKSITSENKNHYESIILMAKSYISMDDIDSASSLLKHLTSEDRDYRAHIMLALCSNSNKESILNNALKTDNKKAEFPQLYWDFSNMSYSHHNSEMSIAIFCQ